MSTMVRSVVVAMLVWLGIAGAQAGQAYAVALWRNEQQAWWPTLSYAVAVHSIWFILTFPLVLSVRRIEGYSRAAFGAVAYLLMWPAVTALHVALFALLWWPVYNDGGRIATRWAMADVMFVRNFATNSLYFAAIVAIVITATHWRRRSPARVPEPVNALIIRVRGTVRRIPLTEIDWIGAAGDYAEVHSGSMTHMIEEPLRSLAERLPPGDFARIHRGSVIRIDRISEIRAAGRGDAAIRLVTGAELKLSRRFRKNLDLLSKPPVAPASRADRSRSQNITG